MAQTSSNTTRSKAADAAPDAGPATETKTPEVSKKGVGVGEPVWYQGHAGPVLAVAMQDFTGEGTVLLLADGELPRARSVSLYDTAEDAAGAGLEHTAYHL